MIIKSIDVRTTAPFEFRVGALLCDLDGTLFDTFPFHWQSANRALEALGHRHRIPWEQYLGLTVKGGKKVVDYLPRCVCKDDFYALKDSIYESILMEGLMPLPGVEKILLECELASVPFAIVTSARRNTVDILMRSCWRWKCPSLIICYEDVLNLKPEPDGYLLASQILGIPSDLCVVCEDSPIGCQSAIRAGMPAIVPVTKYFAAKEISESAIVVSSLEGLMITNSR